MRYVFTMMSVLSVLAITASANQQGDKAQPAQTCTLKVSGMFCGACAKTVEKTAKKIDGVKSAKVSQPKGVADITYDPARTTPEAIAKAIAEKTPFKSELVRKP